LDRALYSAADFERFVGLGVRVKLLRELGGQKVLRGVILAVEADGVIQLETEQGAVGFPHADVDSARLVFDLSPAKPKSSKKAQGVGGKKAPQAEGRGGDARSTKSPRSE
jgi:hypothetical protein